MSIVEKSIQRPLLLFVIFTVLTMGGIVCYTLLPLNLLPKFELPNITVVTVYPGAGAVEVESSVTKKLEDALSSLENLNKITSVSQEGVSVISIALNEGADANQAIQDAQRKINAIKSSLPADVLEPSIDKISMDEKPIMNVAITSTLSPTDFYKIAEDRILPRMAKLPGVGTVNLTGGSKREIKVNIDMKKLEARHLSIMQALKAIQSSNMEIPAGNIENKEAVYSVRLAAKYASPDELRQTVIATSAGGGKIRVMDIAEVEDGVAEQKLINRMNGSDAIGLSISKQSDANAVRVADLAKAEFKLIEAEYAKDNIRFEIASDSSVFTREASASIVFDLILAILIVSVICFLFLHNVQSALIVMVAVPLSIIPAFIAMYIFGYSLNMMSLLAVSLVVGILVDDSIVVVENMFRQLEQGKNRRQAALEGCEQIMFTVTSITLVIVVVFFPLIISGGLIGNILEEFAVPIIISTLCSLFVSFTLTPILMSRFGKRYETGKSSLISRFPRFVEHIFETLKNGYASLLDFALKHKISVLLLAFILFISAFMLIPQGFIGTTFIPELDQGEFIITLEMNPQVTIYQNNQISMQAEKIIAAKPEVVSVYTNIGTAPSLSVNSAKNSITSIYVKMTEKDKRTIGVADFAAQIKEEVMQIPGIRARAEVASTLSGVDPIRFTVQGVDRAQVESTARMILDIVRRTPGVTDARFSTDDPRQEVQVKLDRGKVAEMGLSPEDIGRTLRVALTGNNDSKYMENDSEYNITVRADESYRTGAGDIERLTFINKTGELITLNQFAQVSYGLGPSMIERSDRITSVSVKSNVLGRPAGTVASEIRTQIQGKIPVGVTIREGGMMEQQRNAFSNLGFAFLAAIILIYLIMVALYNSLSDPLVVLFSIPLSLIGALFALALSLTDLSIFSIIGIITLIGLVVKNAILLIDFVNHNRQTKGMDTVPSLIEAGKERLRPILMTTFAMIFGMLPIAVASGHGAELKNGMAWVIIGGLTSSMLLTLFIVPVVYCITDRIRIHFPHPKAL
jgi:HAE1 family hydrophobic/amphiphilic exporter-1